MVSTTYNHWQNITGILKSVFKIPSLLYTMLRTNNIAWHKFWSLFLSIDKRIVQIAVFPIIFVSDFLKNLQNFKCGILLLFILNQIEGMYLPIMSLLYKS